MTRIVSGVLLLWLSLNSAHDTAAIIRIVTYNIHHGEGTDGQFDLPRLANVILALEPDLVTLQEVDRGTERAGGVDQLAEFARLTGMHATFGKAIDYRGGSYGVAVLSRVPALSTSVLPLPGAPDREARAALTVLVPASERGPLVQFTSTHLDQGRGPESRQAQASYLNELLLSEESRPAILAGDMNTRSDAEVMELFPTRWLNATAGDQSRLDPEGRPRPRGDLVFVRPAARWRVIETRVVDDPIASDHRPVLVVLEWIPA